MTRKEYLKARLPLYLEAEKAVLRGQSYTIHDRQLTRANLAEIRKAIDDMIDELATLDNVNGRTKRVVFIE